MAEVSTVAAVLQPLKVYGGDDWALSFVFWNGVVSDNDPIDIRNYGFIMEVKEDPLGPVKLSLTNEVGGGFTVNAASPFNALDVFKRINLKGKEYVYDLQITYQDGSIETYLYGPFVVVQDVTKSIGEK